MLTMCFIWLMFLHMGRLIMSETVEKIASPVILGEGPHWDVQSQKLYFVDIVGQKISRFDPATGNVTSTYLKDGPVGVAIPVKGSRDKFIAGCGRDIVLVTWDGEKDDNNPSFKKLASLDTDRTDTRINDGKCDPAGRFWVGTMANEVNNTVELNRGTLYVFEKDSNPKSVFSPVSISNGLAWNADNNMMYYIDSLTRQIYSFDYNLNDGSIKNKNVVFDLSKNNIKGVPDGMTIDTNGNLWIAVYDGSAVIHVDPRNGKLLRTIKMPVDKITSVAFGGPLLDILYVTSANNGMTAEEKLRKPDSGALFAVKNLGVRGLPPVDFKYDN